MTERAGHARTLVSSSDLSDISGIVTVGGDGLLYEVVNGLRSRVDANSVADVSWYFLSLATKLVTAIGSLNL